MINLVLDNPTFTRVYLTLREKAQCVEEFEAIFKITSRQTNFTNWFTSANLTTSPSRYDEYRLKAVSDESLNDPLSGTFYVPQPGLYDYEVWGAEPGMFDFDDPIITPDLIKLEVGFMKITRESVPTPTFDEGPQTIPSFQ